MRRAACLPGAFLALVLLAPSAKAQCCYLWPPRAPDMCGMGYYTANCWGQVYGPCYNVYPPFPPFQGVVFPPAGGGGAGGPGGPGGPGGAPTFPTHPWARSPRDYFMIDFEGRSNPYTYGYISSGGAVLGVTTGTQAAGPVPVPVP